jgi:hypothetical protein
MAVGLMPPITFENRFDGGSASPVTTGWRCFHRHGGYKGGGSTHAVEGGGSRWQGGGSLRWKVPLVNGWLVSFDQL